MVKIDCQFVAELWADEALVQFEPVLYLKVMPDLKVLPEQGSGWAAWALPS